jgi:hypothetical protein
LIADGIEPGCVFAVESLPAPCVMAGVLSNGINKSNVLKPELIMD